ncbi:hypothetical protein INP57_15920 [Saccharopolyspora sp. HNM0986]|uniref:hypothetical protein n=1 Tax=Saccharopolyspora galaxeae TaxID=2781241 RepID=UPI0019093547|nr:hypothetical protein [Saccharopolyspora sp. HNM0986]MBK0868301.1 hypothetical protein [Saccharopolyspora sp. HNM0986]
MSKTDNKVHVPIEKIPFLGATWYTRGPDYWFRRVLASILMFIGLMVTTAITGGLIGAIVTSSVALPVKVVALLVIASAIGYSLVRAFAAFIRVEKDRSAGKLLRPGLDSSKAIARNRRYGGAGIVVAALARVGSFLAGALLVVSVVFCFGWFVVLFIWTFQKELGVEHDARVRHEQKMKGRA